MTWSEYRTYLIERMKVDFSVAFDVSDATQTGAGTLFNTRAQQHLALFTRESYTLYGTRLALDLSAQAGNFQIDLKALAAKPVFEPERVLVSGTEVYHKRASEILRCLPITPATATPTQFGIVSDYKIVFNSKLTSANAAASNYIDGYYAHPAIADADSLEISDEHAEAASMYSAALYMESAVKGEDAEKRLSYYKSRARAEVRRIKGDMLERMNRSY